MKVKLNLAPPSLRQKIDGLFPSWFYLPIFGNLVGENKHDAYVYKFRLKIPKHNWQGDAGLLYKYSGTCVEKYVCNV